MGLMWNVEWTWRKLDRQSLTDQCPMFLETGNRPMKCGASVWMNVEGQVQTSPKSRPSLRGLALLGKDSPYALVRGNGFHKELRTGVGSCEDWNGGELHKGLLCLWRPLELDLGGSESVEGSNYGAKVTDKLSIKFSKTKNC